MVVNNVILIVLLVVHLILCLIAIDVYNRTKNNLLSIAAVLYGSFYLFFTREILDINNEIIDQLVGLTIGFAFSIGLYLSVKFIRRWLRN
jgi:hypothetical protein